MNFTLDVVFKNTAGNKLSVNITPEQYSKLLKFYQINGIEVLSFEQVFSEEDENMTIRYTRVEGLTTIYWEVEVVE